MSVIYVDRHAVASYRNPRWYLKRRGKLCFWRMGRIGGSFYLSCR